MQLNRRNFLTLVAGTFVASTAASTVYFNQKNEADDPVVDRVEIPVKKSGRRA